MVRDFVLFQKVTTSTDVLAKMGQPWRTDLIDPEFYYDESVRSIAYNYASSKAAPHVPGITNPSRLLALDFYNDTLVGYSYSSSFKSDATNFDSSKVKTISEGDECDKAADVFGPAHGEAIYPMTEKEGTSEYLYSYSHLQIESGFFGRPIFCQKYLSISCDEADKIIQIQLIEDSCPEY